VVDGDRVLRLLDYVRRDVHVLARAADLGSERLLADELALDAVKYRFVTAIEGCARVAHHLAAAEGWGASESNADAVRLLVAHGVVSEPSGDQVARAMGFRNVLVHRYAEVRDELVVAQLRHLDDLLDFTSAVAQWLGRGDSSA
jgi:uncharacterized protein YutE (UPF0331/DUF86 family)